MRILIVGGYGTFGGRLVRLLADDARLTALVAGRSLEKAQSLCADIDAKAKLVPTAFDRARDARQQIATLKSDILVDASGPVQIYGDNPYALVEACLAQRVHYIDLADAPDFVDGIAGFDAEASDAGIAILSGASTTPVLTTDVMRKLAQGIAPRTITAGIAPSPHSEIGLSVVRAAASYAGKPLTIRRNGTEVQRVPITSDDFTFHVAADRTPDEGPLGTFWGAEVFDVNRFPGNEIATVIANPDLAEMVAGVQDAIRSDNLRFDASDAMPQEIGFGAFNAGMVRLFREGSPENLDELSFDIAHDIEATWLKLEAPD